MTTNKNNYAVEVAHARALKEDEQHGWASEVYYRAHVEALDEEAKRNFCTDFQKKAAALPAPNLNSAFAKKVAALLDDLAAADVREQDDMYD